MSWSYDPTNLGTDTEAERVNSVRFLVGDTDSTDQQLQNEEIIFSLGENNDDIYATSIYLCSSLSAKYARLVNTELDGALREDYSDLVDNYKKLAQQLKEKQVKLNANIYIGGVSKQAVSQVDQDTDRVDPAFTIGQFDNDRFKKQ